MKKILKKNIPKTYHQDLINLRNIFFNGYCLKSYFQEGEDIILRRIFEKQKQVFMLMLVHIFRNVFLILTIFLKKGRRGININATPGCTEVFRKIKPRGTNLEFAISDKRQTLIDSRSIVIKKYRNKTTYSNEH